MEKSIKQPEGKGSRQSLAEKEAVKAKTRILNLLIALAAVLNLCLGWQLGTLYGPRFSPAAQAISCPESGASNVSRVLPSACTQQDQVEELNRRIARVIDQLTRMNLPPDTVLIIRPDGPALAEADDPVLNAASAGTR